MKIKPLATPAMIISFDDAEASQIKFLRKNLIAKIKLAKNYAGSSMEAAIKEFEKQQNGQQGASEGQGEAKKGEPQVPPKQAAKEAAKKTTKKVPEPPVDDDDFDDIPF